MSKKDGNQHFISDTEHVLGRLRPALAIIIEKRKNLEQNIGDLMQRRSNIATQLANEYIPDLGTKTVAQLKSYCKSFVTRPILDAVYNATEVKVPFWTWLFGGSAEYKKQVYDEQLALVRVQFRSWLDAHDDRPIGFAELGRLDAQIAELTSSKSVINKQEERLKAQIRGLEQARSTYSSQHAPEPPADLRNAVQQSASGMRANPHATIDTTTTSSSGPSLWDYILFDHIINDHSSRDDRRRDGDYQQTPTGDPWGHPSQDNNAGSSSRINVDNTDRDGGGSSSTLFVGDDNRDGGGNASKLELSEGGSSGKLDSDSLGRYS